MAYVYTLCGVGFNAFEQLKVTTASEEAVPTHRSTPTAVRATDACDACDGELTSEALSLAAARAPFKLLSFGSRSPAPNGPDRINVSACWDSLHVHVRPSRSSTSSAKDREVEPREEGNDTPRVLTTGRWSRVLSCEALRRCLEERESIVSVQDVTKNLLIIHTMTRTLLLRMRSCSSDPDDSAKKTEEPYVLEDTEESAAWLSKLSSLGSLSGGRIFILTEGRVFECFESTSTTDAPPVLKLGPSIHTPPPSPPVAATAHVRQLAVGGDHALLLSERGDVFSFGVGSRGQLGHGDIEDRQSREPCLIEALAGVTVAGIACGKWHSVALSAAGDVYSWGWNKHGQLGHSASVPAVCIPGLIDADPSLTFVSVACGTRHSVALSNGGSMYAWGWNGYGQLGTGDIETISRCKPTQVHVDFLLTLKTQGDDEEFSDVGTATCVTSIGARSSGDRARDNGNARGSVTARVCAVFCGDWNTFWLAESESKAAHTN